MSDELVERLRNRQAEGEVVLNSGKVRRSPDAQLCKEAADEIERLERELEEARTALLRAGSALDWVIGQMGYRDGEPPTHISDARRVVSRALTNERERTVTNEHSGDSS